MGSKHNTHGQVSAGDIDRLATDLALSVVRLARRLRLRRQGTHFLTLSQLSILAVLNHDGPMTPSALAEVERVRPPTITRAIHTLEAAGLITRIPHPTTRRITVLAMTAASTTTLAADADARYDWLRDQLDHLTPNDRDTLQAAAHIITTIIATDTP